MTEEAVDITLTAVPVPPPPCGHPQTGTSMEPKMVEGKEVMQIMHRVCLKCGADLTKEAQAELG